MPDREVIIKEIERLMVHFPNYHPVLEGDVNVVSEFFETFKAVPAGAFREALHDLTVQPNRKFAPSTGEIFHALSELKYKGMSNIERMAYDMGIRPASEVIAELGIGNITDEEQKAKNAKFMAERDQK
jgi:hypothetical protein